MTQTSTGLAKGAAAPESANGDRIGFGIGCALVGLFGMSVMDACAKLLGSGYAVSQVILARNGLGALAVVVFVLLTGSGLACLRPKRPLLLRSEEHTSELPSLMRISYAVLCLQK